MSDLRLPYDILGALPAFATSVGELYAWALVDRYLNKVTTPLLYRSVVINRKMFNKLARHHKSHVTSTSTSYTLNPPLPPLPLSPLLPFSTLLANPHLAAHTLSLLCTLPSLHGPGTPAFLDTFASALLACPNLRSVGWRTQVRNTDRITRVLPRLSGVREVELGWATCPLVSGGFGGGGRGDEEWMWDYVSGWTDPPSLPSLLPHLEHLHLPYPQPHTTPLWLPYLHSLTLASPLRSLTLTLSSPSLDPDPIPTPLLVAIALAHAGTLRAFASGAGRVECEGMRGLLGVCGLLERVQWAGFEGSHDPEPDVLSCLSLSGPHLELAIVREVYWTKGGNGQWRVGEPEWERLVEFERGVRMPEWEAERGWWGEE